MVALMQSPVPPLLFSIVLLTSSTLALSSRHNATHRPRPRVFGTSEDYSDYSDEDLSLSTSKPDAAGPPCRYDLCQDQQEPCHELAQTTGCSCPGMSNQYEPPDSPHLRSLSFEGPYTVVVRWCAPASAVTHYLVQVGAEGQDQGRQAGEKRRLMDLGYVAPGTEVCVLAVNGAGASKRESRSCSRFEPRPAETGLALKLGLIAGAVVLLVLLALGLLVWWCRRRRKSTQTGSRGA